MGLVLNSTLITIESTPTIRKLLETEFKLVSLPWAEPYQQQIRTDIL